MRKMLVVFLPLIISIYNYLGAQDTLVLKNKSKMLVEIKQIELNEIKYSSLTGGVVLSINKEEVDYIAYNDGYKLKVNEKDTLLSKYAPKELYLQGINDAQHYYEGYRGAATGTLVVSLLSPLVGLIPAIACSATTPLEKNLQYPDSKLYHDIDYQRGYVKQAKKIKSGKVWRNWGIAFGVNVILVILMQQ